jgi:hypothetical protein
MLRETGEDGGSAVPKVSVVVPTRDRPTELARAVRTVQAQSETAWELIVVDDGSVPAVTLRPAWLEDPRIRLVRHETSRGVSAARNTGIELATAPWIAFLDDDDLWWPHKLEAQLAAAEQHDATFLFSARVTVDPGGRMISSRPAASIVDLTRDLLRRNFVGEPSCVMVHRDVLARSGGFDSAFSVIADWEMWLRVSLVARPWGLDETTVAIVAHPGSMQFSMSAGIPGEVAALRARQAEIAGATGAELDTAHVELWMANKHWRGSRSPASLAAYIRVARRHRRVWFIARGVVGQQLRRADPRPPQLGPEWALRQLGAGGPKAGAGPASGPRRPAASTSQ